MGQGRAVTSGRLRKASSTSVQLPRRDEVPTAAEPVALAKPSHPGVVVVSAEQERARRSMVVALQAWQFQVDREMAPEALAEDLAARWRATSITTRAQIG